MILPMLKGLVGSRKWFVGLAGVLILMLNHKLGLNLTDHEQALIAGVIVVMIGGEAYRDGKAAAGREEPPGTAPK